LQAVQKNTQTENVLCIVDPLRLQQFTEKIFCRLPASILDNNTRYPVQAIRHLAPHIEISHQLPANATRTILVEHDTNLLMLECDVVNRTDAGSELLRPKRLLARKRPERKEERVKLNGTDSRFGLVRHCIPHMEFYRCAAEYNPARDQLVAKYSRLIRELIPESLVRIEFQKSNRFSVRMKKLSRTHASIFEPQIGAERQAEHRGIITMPAADYAEIAQTDNLGKNFISEICEPLRYKNLLTIGYIQVLSKNFALNARQRDAVSRVARKLESDLCRIKCFPENPLWGTILDWSPCGMGFSYPRQRNLLSAAEEGTQILIEVHFKPENIATFSGQIVHSTLHEGAIHYGVEFRSFLTEHKATFEKIAEMLA
jgi:hypothetical protein